MISSGDVSRARLKKVLKLLTPAEIELLSTQFLGKHGLKIKKGTKQN